MKRILFLMLAVLLHLMVPPAAQAHETTRSYLTIARAEDALRITLSMAFRDLEVAVWLDDNLDGQITWAEVQLRQTALNAYAAAALQFDAGGNCPVRAVDQAVSETGGLAYLDLEFSASCPDARADLTVSSRLFADVDPDHRIFLTMINQGQTPISRMLGPQPSQTRLAGMDAGAWGLFATYVQAGALHLAGGADHIMFLLVLMLPAVAGTGPARQAALRVLLAATGFTLAHALTLSAASFGILRPNTDVIAFLVALSIILTALDNLRPFIAAPRSVVAAFFGLIHGFGFASVLSGSALSSGGLFLALLGFNLGIELAQIALVLVTMPALFMLQAGRPLVWIGSSVAAVAGLYWAGLSLKGWLF
jgi:hypothetical protein